MGSNNSRNVQVRKNSDRLRIYEPKSGVSRWYEACQEGNYSKLIVLLPFLTYDQLNRMESNGSTCLHVACYRSHKEIALALLICGCDRNAKNKYGLTPLQETTDDEIRQYFTYDIRALRSASGVLYTNLTDDSFAPCNKYIIGHVSIDHVYDAKEMVKAYRTTGIKIYTLTGMQSMSYLPLRRMIKRWVPETDGNYKKAMEYIDREDVFELIKLYTLETSLYRYLHDDNADFTAAIFINLSKFQNRAYKGRTYRGAKMAHFDVNAWKWATKETGRIIETQTFISTSEIEQVARVFASYPVENKVSVLFTLDFPQTCDTAIKLTKDEPKKINENLTQFPREKEVLVTPYTLFQVNSVEFDEQTKWYRIHLTNMPIKV